MSVVFVTCHTTWVGFKADSKIFELSLDQFELAVNEPRISIARRERLLHSRMSDTSRRHRGRNKQSLHRIVRNIISYLRKSNQSITSSYAEWVKVGLAIANTFTFSGIGERYFQELSVKMASLWCSACSQMLHYLYVHRRINVVKFGSIIYMAESKVSQKLELGAENSSLGWHPCRHSPSQPLREKMRDERWSGGVGGGRTDPSQVEGRLHVGNVWTVIRLFIDWLDDWFG